MWSGNITGQGDSYPTQWALNPSAQYLHMPPEQGKIYENLINQKTCQFKFISFVLSSSRHHIVFYLVDWASLAQQWIKMKEETPQTEKEQGEAPMDITKEDIVSPTPAPSAIPNPPAWPTTPIQSGEFLFLICFITVHFFFFFYIYIILEFICV